MLTLVTSNPARYAPFAVHLEGMRLKLEPPGQALPEIQSLNFTETLTAKARAAAELFGRPVIVDDAGLVLEAYAPFPGPLTATVLRSLGATGLRRLLAGASARGAMECHLGCWVQDALRSWSGSVEGRIDLSRAHRDDRMLLTDLFVADQSDAGPVPNKPGVTLPESAVPGGSLAGHPPFAHRARALAALKADVFELLIETSAPFANKTPVSVGADYDCPFCAELENDSLSLFATMMGDCLPSRIIYEDEHFVVMPPMGEFMEGGLLVLTREHILSLAYLAPEQLDHLERLLQAIERALVKHWGVAPLIFEHGPAAGLGKGVCCVDHAHLNIFPAPVHIHPHLAERMSMKVGRLTELARLRRIEFGYLFVQENDGPRRAYDGRDVPTQLVRRIIATQLGIPERWHWRDYLGRNELLATYKALKGQIQL